MVIRCCGKLRCAGRHAVAPVASGVNERKNGAVHMQNETLTRTNAGIMENLKRMPVGLKLMLMGMPFFAFVFVFSYLPLYGWIYAFFNYKPGLPLTPERFVGWKYFISMVSDPITISEVLRVMRNTLAMSFLGLLTSPLPMVFAIFLSEMRSKHFKKMVQTITTIPNFISWVLMFSVIFAMFSLEDGFVNNVLLKLGLIENPINFMASQTNIWLKMLTYSLVKGLGWSAVIYIAALTSIDPQLYDAAQVDGAGRFRIIWHIKIPGLIETYFVLVLLQLAGFINTGMEQYYVFQNAMNRQYIEVLDLYVYTTGIVGNNYSFATAIGMLKTVVSVVLLLTANKMSKWARGESII